MLFATQLIGFGAGGDALPTYTWNTPHVVDATDQTTYTFSNAAIGTAATNRLVVVTGRATDADTGQTLSSATIGGVSATIVVQHDAGGGETAISFIVSAVVPTGTTGDVVLTFSSVFNRCGIASYSLYNLASTTAGDTASAVDVGNVVTLSVDTLANSIVIACSGQTGTASVTWAGVTIDGTETTLEGTAEFTTASAQVAAASTPLAVTATWTAGANHSGCSATWR